MLLAICSPMRSLRAFSRISWMSSSVSPFCAGQCAGGIIAVRPTELNLSAFLTM